MKLFSDELKIAPEELETDEPFQDYGVDSIILAQLLQQMNQALKEDLDPSVLYEHPTIDAFAEWLVSIDPSVKFEKVHVNFMGFAGRDLQDEVTTGMLIGRVLKREQALNTAIFNYIHRQRATIANAEDVRSIFLVNGVTAEEFDKTKKSFAVKNMLRKNNKTIDEFRRFVSGVPNFIVNDKYQATFTRDMTPDDMVDLIVYLSELK